MEKVIKLLERRKAAVKVELSYTEIGNKHYEKCINELNKEIQEIDMALKILLKQNYEIYGKQKQDSKTQDYENKYNYFKLFCILISLIQLCFIYLYGSYNEATT